jgi:type I restriction enzyme, S subunit
MISDATEGSKCITSTKKRIRSEGAQRSRFVKAGDFLLTNSMSFGKPYILRTEGCIHDGWLVLSPRSGNVDADFFYHLLGSKAVYSEFERRASGATVKNLNIDLVRGVTVPLPPLPEQRRIAAILNKADELRAKRRVAIAKLDNLTQSIFLDMFGDPATNPKGWPVMQLKDCTARIQIGPFGSLLHQEDYVDGGIPLVNPKHIQNREIQPDASETISTRKFAELAAYHLQAGDVVMGRRGEMGRCAIVNEDSGPLLCGTGSLFIRPDNIHTMSLFLLFLLSSAALKSRLERLSLGQTLPNLNSQIVEGLTVLLPPLIVQREFATKIAAMRSITTTQIDHATALDCLFASLQHQAFSGDF